jgi:hypothetical protein
MATERLGLKQWVGTDKADFLIVAQDNEKTDGFAKEIGVETDYDTRNVDITRTNGKISQVTYKAADGVTVLKTVTVNRVNGKVASVTTVHNGKTTTETVQRDPSTGKITSVTKTVV